MIACYDLARCPPTYDVVAFLALLELERIRCGEDRISALNILPGPAGGFRRDNHWPDDIGTRQLMRERVLVPLCRMLPAVDEVRVQVGREGSYGFGRDQYLVGLPAIVRALRAGSRPLRGPIVVRDPRLITFTLREADHHPLRNSCTEQWVEAAGRLCERGLDVVVVRDTARASAALPGVRTDSAAALSIDRRAELYSRAALNVGVSNGPMWMAIFMDVPVLMLRPTTNAARGCYDDVFYAKYGVPRGEQLPTSPRHQHLAWVDDDADTIVRCVEDMMAACPR